MARQQVERWASLHPTCPKNGSIMEIPFVTKTLPKMVAICAVAAATLYVNQALFWNHKPESLTPEFQAEAKKIGNIAASAASGSMRWHRGLSGGVSGGGPRHIVPDRRERGALLPCTKAQRLPCVRDCPPAGPSPVDARPTPPPSHTRARSNA